MGHAGVKPCCQTLVFRKQMLESSKNLSECGIVAGAVVILLVNQRAEEAIDGEKEEQEECLSEGDGESDSEEESGEESYSMGRRKADGHLYSSDEETEEEYLTDGDSANLKKILMAYKRR